MGWTKVQTQRNDGTSTAPAVTLASTPAAGNLLVAYLNARQSVTTGPWGATADVSDAYYSVLAIYHKVAASGESKTVSVTLAGSALWNLVVEEWSGNAASPLDVTVSGRAAADTNITTISTGATAALASAGELAVAAAGKDTDKTVTAASNAYSLGSSASYTSSLSMGTASNPSVGAAATSTTFTLSATDQNWHAVLVTFKPGASAPAYSGAGSLTGTGTLTAAGSPTPAGSAALTGTGTLTTTGRPAPARTRPLTGTGTLTVTGQPAAAGAAALTGTGTLSGSGLGWVTRTGPQLYLAGQPFRFTGANLYWLGLDDNLRDGSGNPTYPSTKRIDSGYAAATAMGATVVRAHTLGISVGSSYSLWPTYGATPAAAAWAPIDYAIYRARQLGMRLIIPLTDQYRYYHGGKWTFVHWAYQAGVSGVTDTLADTSQQAGNSNTEKTAEAQFYTSSGVISMFQAYIQMLLTHVNAYTGVALKDDPTILAWETGNELWDAPAAWTEQIATYIKSIAPRHLVSDGHSAAGVAMSDTAIGQADVDIVGLHGYNVTTASVVAAGAKQAYSAGKAFVVGEYDPGTQTSTSDDLPTILAAYEAAPIAGDLIWCVIPYEDDGTTIEPHGEAYSIASPPFDNTAAGGYSATGMATAISRWSTHASYLAAHPAVPAPATNANLSLSTAAAEGTDPSLWTAASSSGTAPTLAYDSGQNAIKVTFNAHDYAWAYLTNPVRDGFDVTGLATVSAQLAVTVPAGTSVTGLDIKVVFENSSGTVVGSTSGPGTALAAGGTTIVKNENLAVPSGATRAFIQPETNVQPAIGDVLYFRHAQVNSGSTALAYQTPGAAAAYSGTASLTGAGALSSTGRPAVIGASVLTGSGTLTTARAAAATGSISLTGTGTLIAAGTSKTAGSYDATILADAPVGWWQLSEPSGTAAADSSGGGYPGTATALTWGVAGPLLRDQAETAATFDGSSSKVAIPTDPALVAFTVEFWVNAQGAAQSYSRVFSDGYVGGTNKGVDVFVNGTSALQVLCTVGNGTTTATVGTNGTLPLTGWHHVAVVYNGTTVRIYLDATLDPYSASLAGPLAANSGKYQIGNNPSFGAYFTGSLAQVALYQTALSGTRVAAHYAAATTTAVTAALTGAGVLTAVGATATGSTAALTGAGALTTTGGPGRQAAASLTGTGALTTGSATRAGAVAALTGTGVLTVAGSDPIRAQHRAEFEALCPSGTRTVYVATTGNDTAAGTQAAPYATLGKALSQAQAGDRILLAAGTYAATSNMYGKAGTSAKWITIQPVDDTARVVLDGSNLDDAGVLYFQQCSYFGVFGLEIRANQTQSRTDMSGLAIFRGCHHGVIWANRIHDVPSGGVNCFWVDANATYGIPAGSHDLLDIAWNTIWAAAKYDPNNSSGISIAEPIDSGLGTWPDGYAYHVHDNYVFDVQCLQPYTNGGYSFITDGNGISIDAFSPSNHPSQVPNYTKPVLVKANITTGCGGRGVHVHNALNTRVEGNTAIGNLRTDSPAIDGSCELDGDTDTSVVIAGNVILPRNTPNWATGNAAYTQNLILGGTQAVTGDNLDQRALGYGYFTGPLSDASLTTEQPRSAFTSAVTIAAGTAALTGSSTLTAAGAARTTSTAALTGAGALTAAAAPGARAAAALTGSGTLTASGTGSTSGGGAAALTGSGTISGTGRPAAAGGVALAGAGALTANGQPIPASQAALTGLSTLATTTAAALNAAAALTGFGQLTALGVRRTDRPVVTTPTGLLMQPALAGLQLGGLGPAALLLPAAASTLEMSCG